MKESGVNQEEERAVKELRNLDAASVKLEGEANKLDAEAKKLDAEGRKIERTAYTDAVKLSIAQVVDRGIRHDSCRAAGR